MSANLLNPPQAANMLTAALARTGPQDALALAQLVREAVAAGAERQALHLRMSGLNDRLKAEHHHRLVREALEPLLRPTRSRLFELPNGDLVAVVPPRSNHVDVARAALDVLLHADGELPGQAYTALRLPHQAAALLAVVEDSLGSASAAPAPALTGRFDAAGLAELERVLGSASLAAHLRQRPVCRLRPGGQGPEPEWQEYRVATTELCATLLPGAAPAGMPWLHRRLKRLLDRRLLAELARPEDIRQMGRIGLSLTVQGLTDPEFLRLDSLLGQDARRHVTLGLSVSELLADPEGFAFAASFCRTRGYRLALEEVEAATLTLLPVAGLGGTGLAVDLLKLRWSSALTQLGARLTEALPSHPDSVVLTGVDRAAAIGWGWENGITLFQGSLVGVRGR
jgi:hypothetical protein